MPLRTNYIETAKSLYFLVIFEPFFFFGFDCCLIFFRASLCSDATQCALLIASAKLNVGTTTSHVCCDCYRAFCTCLSDNQSLAGMVLRVQNFVLDSVAGEKGRKML